MALAPMPTIHDDRPRVEPHFDRVPRSPMNEITTFAYIKRTGRTVTLRIDDPEEPGMMLIGRVDWDDAHNVAVILSNGDIKVVRKTALIWWSYTP